MRDTWSSASSKARARKAARQPRPQAPLPYKKKKGRKAGTLKLASMRIYKTIKGASIQDAQGRKLKKKTNKAASFPYIYKGGKGRRGGAIPNPISIVLSSVLLVVLLSV